MVGFGGLVGASTPCPCGSGDTYGSCCRRLHLGEVDATTAEDLMRSRYSAHVVGDDVYLTRSWDPASRPTEISSDRRIRWTGLEVLRTTAGRAGDADGTVEFIASYRVEGDDRALHEVSRFQRVAGRWVYVDGDDCGPR